MIIVLLLLIISLILLSIIAIDIAKENFALGYTPPIRAKDLSYNVYDTATVSDSSKLVNKTNAGFSFEKDNWNFGGPI